MENPSLEVAIQNLEGNDQLRVLLVDSGGRGHALAWHLLGSPLLKELIVAPGNGGTASEAGPISNVNLSPTDTRSIVEFSLEYGVDLVIPAMDDSLAAGVVDKLAAAGVPAFGPTRDAAQVEWSKGYAKDLMRAYGIPTETSLLFENSRRAIRYLSRLTEVDFPIVVKQDGLALGKGVTVCLTPEEAHEAMQAAPGVIVVEEYLDGQEVSLHALCGVDEHGQPVFKMFPSSQDHKQINDGDRGPNTGGMGTFGPLPWLGEQAVSEAGEMFVRPMLEALAASGRPFVGSLYPGIILPSRGPRVLEYNARFGDPETQTYMRLLDEDLLGLSVAALNRRLTGGPLRVRPGAAACVVVAAPGYPGSYEKGLPINGIAEAEEIQGVKVMHAGTRRQPDGSFVSTGGRILGVTASGNNLNGALYAANQAVGQIRIPGAQYRTDIGQRAWPEAVGFTS